MGISRKSRNTEGKKSATAQGLENMVKLEPLKLPSTPFMPAGIPPLRLKESELAGRSALRTSSYTIYVDLPGNADDMPPGDHQRSPPGYAQRFRASIGKAYLEHLSGQETGRALERLCDA